MSYLIVYLKLSQISISQLLLNIVKLQGLANSYYGDIYITCKDEKRSGISETYCNINEYVVSLYFPLNIIYIFFLLKWLMLKLQRRLTRSAQSSVILVSFLLACMMQMGHNALFLFFAISINLISHFSCLDHAAGIEVQLMNQ